jgi:tetratricopeptide (TPR) repeat protein
MHRGSATAGVVTRRVSAVVLVWALLAQSGAAEPNGSDEARAALALCREIEQAREAEQPALLERGLVRAEVAVAADPDDPVAHLAVFCNLGKRLRRDGISWHAFGAVRRLLREIDTALALAPDFAGALAAKGGLLASLPRFLGGDPREGERLVRRAISLAPDDVGARLTLVDVLEARGAHDEAQAEAEAALALVQHAVQAPELARTQAVVARLRR